MVDWGKLKLQKKLKWGAVGGDNYTPKTLRPQGCSPPGRRGYRSQGTEVIAPGEGWDGRDRVPWAGGKKFSPSHNMGVSFGLLVPHWGTSGDPLGTPTRLWVSFSEGEYSCN